MSRKNCDKDAVISRLKKEKADLESQVNELKYIVHDAQATNHLMNEQISDMRELIEQDATRECGCVTIANSTCYQDFVGILINNGYAVEVEQIAKGQLLKITIKEGEE